MRHLTNSGAALENVDDVAALSSSEMLEACQEQCHLPEFTQMVRDGAVRAHAAAKAGATLDMEDAKARTQAAASEVQQVENALGQQEGEIQQVKEFQQTTLAQLDGLEHKLAAAVTASERDGVNDRPEMLNGIEAAKAAIDGCKSLCNDASSLDISPVIYLHVCTAW